MINQVFIFLVLLIVSTFVSCQEINDINDINSNNKRQRYHKIDTISTDAKITQSQQHLRLQSSKDATTTESSASSDSYAELIMSQLQEHVSGSTNNIVKEDDRDLQLNIGTIVQIVDTACGLVGNLMLLDGTANCDCSLSLQLKFGCSFVQDVCTGNFCTVPQVNGTFDLLQTKVTFSYCSNDGTFNSNPLPNFCVAVSGNLVAPAGVLGRNDNNNNTTKSNSIFRKRQFLNKIAVSVDGVPCQSASICNNGQGYVFDCTNINNQLIQSTCTTIQTITNLYQSSGIKFLPQLDVLPKSIPIPVPVPVPVPIPVPVPTSAPSTTFSYLFNSLFQQLLLQQKQQQAQQGPLTPTPTPKKIKNGTK
jgi:hypothetical protein